MQLTQPLHQALQKHPDAVMSVYGDRTRTFAEVADRVARFAGALRGIGVEPGDRVALLSLNSDRFLEYLLSVPWAGGVLNPVNIRWSPAEIAYSLTDSDTRVLIVDDTYLPLVDAIKEQAPGLTSLIYAGERDAPIGLASYEQMIAENYPVEDAGRGYEDIAGIFYTGGTTGFPKGVTLSHRNMMSQYFGILASRCYLRPGGVYLHAAPMFHLADLAGWGAQMIMGGPHVVIPSFNPVGVLEAIERHRVTDALLVPTMVQLLVDDPRVAEFDLSSLETVLYAGSPMSQSVLERAMERFGNAVFIQGWGMTELAAASTMVDPGIEQTGFQFKRSAGAALPHNEVRIVDPDDNEVPRGEVGEIVVRGPNVMMGYWNNDDATRSVLRDGWLHTGDGAYMDDDGYIYIVDRIKDMIVTGGENVFSAEVENALATHPAVATCAVIGVPDEDWGERVHAVVVLHDGQSAEPGELRDYAKTLIAGYKCPRSVEFLDSLPMSGAGKILKRELRERHWQTAERQVN